jgi:CRISPR type III-A-associated RAMP protein Csm5
MDSFQIKTLTPVHVGNGRFLQSKIEYAFGATSIGVVDDAKILDLIGEDRVKLWVQSIEQGTSISSFLKPFVPGLKLDMISSRKIEIKCDKDHAKNQATLKEQISNGMGLPYIPGSSIKGAIRSAIFNQEIRNLNRELSENDLYDFGKLKASVLEKKLFGRDPNHDVFRFLQIGDAYFDPNSTVAINMVNLNIVKQGAMFDSSKNQLIEAIGEKKQTSFSMKLNHSGMESTLKAGSIHQLPGAFRSIDQLFKTININTASLISEDIEFWKDFEPEDSVQEYIQHLGVILAEVSSCSDNECVLRLGHGSGYHFISGNLLNQQNIVSDQHYEAIVNTARPGNARKYSEYPFPKTRRMDENTDLLGFVKLMKI